MPSTRQPFQKTLPIFMADPGTPGLDTPAQRLSWPALEAVHEHFRKIAFEIVDAGETVTPQLLLVKANSNGQVLAIAVSVELMRLMYSGEAGMQSLFKLLPELVSDTPLNRALVEAVGFAPDVFVQINESWVMFPKATSEAYVRPSLHPDRREAVIINLHMPALSIPCMHLIEGAPKRHAVQGDFPLESDIMDYGGDNVLQRAAGRSAPPQ